MIYTIIPPFIVFLYGLCWGSFLNMLAHRIAYTQPLLTTRSHCPSCKNVISWYDNIPVISWIMLGGRCRSCATSIWIGYPLVELATGVLLTALYIWLAHPMFAYPWGSFFIYSIFFSALIGASRTDFDCMVIPQMFSLFLVPLGIAASFFGLIEILPLHSLIGSLAGYGILWIINIVYKKISHRDGIGIGDMEFLAMIGSFLGPLGVWTALMVGSLSGSTIGFFYVVAKKKSRFTKLPFGPFLAAGALVHFFFSHQIYIRLFTAGL